MQQMGMELNKIHAGKANMFLSPLFRDTLASVSGATIELYETDGSAGAAKVLVQESIRIIMRLSLRSRSWLL